MIRALPKKNSLLKMSSSALNFEVTHTCNTTKARVGRLTFGRNHTSRGPIDTPVFMPVGTQGTLKGLTPEQLHQLNCRIILGTIITISNSLIISIPTIHWTNSGNWLCKHFVNNSRM
ncbi:unnamed protein product [Adineta steineri]|uniref:tRNA-guanine(15) transglycosylase-like domain-containing protein n=1 Tax=Adineta steineri TaxID=433720 RepID=A0A814SYA7_9BILA|nr:unnamed protein product [Adineta steineri]